MQPGPAFGEKAFPFVVGAQSRHHEHGVGICGRGSVAVDVYDLDAGQRLPQALQHGNGRRGMHQRRPAIAGIRLIGEHADHRKAAHRRREGKHGCSVNRFVLEQNAGRRCDVAGQCAMVGACDERLCGFGLVALRVVRKTRAKNAARGAGARFRVTLDRRGARRAGCARAGGGGAFRCPCLPRGFRWRRECPRSSRL